MKGLTTSLEEWLQQYSLKVGRSVYVCGEQFKENKTLKCNLAEGEESWSNDDEMLLVDLTRAQLFDGKKILDKQNLYIHSACCSKEKREPGCQ